MGEAIQMISGWELKTETYGDGSVHDFYRMELREQIILVDIEFEWFSVTNKTTPNAEEFFSWDHARRRWDTSGSNPGGIPIEKIPNHGQILCRVDDLINSDEEQEM